MKRSYILLSIFLLIILTLVSCNGNSIDFESAPNLKDLSIEIGEELPGITEYLTGEHDDASFGEGYDQIDTYKVGTYDVPVIIKGKEYKCTLTVNDTVAPTGVVRPLTIRPGDELHAMAFFESVSDKTHVTAEFTDAPSSSVPGRYTVGIKLLDEAGNTSDYSADLLISAIDPVTIEARREFLTAGDLTDIAGAVLVEDSFVPNVPGEHELHVTVNGQDNIALVNIIDTKAPTASSKHMDWFTKDPIAPSKMVSDAFDATEITYSYKEEPDFEKEGSQDVTVILTDAGGNSIEVASSMTLKADNEAPVIYGLQDHMYFYKGEPISYLSTVYAFDNCTSGDEIQFDIDKANVDIYTAGKYDVKYTATDKSGNSTSKTITIELVEKTVSQEELDQVIDKILSEITTDDMTIGQKAFAVYNFIRDKMVYVNDSNKKDYIGEAYRGLTKLRGDCYTFYAATDALMRAIGADTIQVHRKYNTTRPTAHYWLKVNLGTGWYHVDTCNLGPRNFNAFMRTDKEFTDRAPTFWMFDSSLYPASPTTPYKKDY